MSIDSAYFLLFLIALVAMMAQLLIRPVRTENILFAILCASLVMVALQTLTAQVSSPYQYVFALGTCATCNVVWLISRAMFRGSDSIKLRHYIVAIIIALLVISSRSIDLLVSVEWLSQDNISWLKRSIGEVTQLLSSTVLALAFWESVKNFSAATKPAKVQRVLFATTFFAGVFSCTVIVHGFIPEVEQPILRPWFVVCSAIAIITCIWMVLVLQHLERKAVASVEDVANDPQENKQDQLLLQQLESLIIDQKIFLRPDVKMIDLANLLSVSEYKVSRIIRHATTANNFNQYINRFRVEYAKQLLIEEQSQHWTVLVISMESGFASLAPFNRAFKAQVGCTPNQFRSRHLNDSLDKPLPA